MEFSRPEYQSGVAFPFCRGSFDPGIKPRSLSLQVDSLLQEYWSGEPFPSPADLPDPEIEPWSPALQANSLSTELSGKPYPKFSSFPKRTSGETTVTAGI